MQYKKMNDTITVQEHIVMPANVGSGNTLFGGQLMAWIDEIAGIAARRFAACEARTISVSQLVFHLPAHVNDVVKLVGKVIYSGTTSMVVLVETFVEDVFASSGLKKVNTAMLTMVAVDRGGKPTPVPRLIPETEKEKLLFLLGEEAKKKSSMKAEKGSNNH